MKKVWFGVILFLMVLLTIQGALAWSWFGLFPDKLVMLDVQYKTEPTSKLDRLNNFFLSHQEFRSLPEGTSIGLLTPKIDNSNNAFLITEKGIISTENQNTIGQDVNIWVTSSFFERLLSTSDVCKFFTDLKLSPEDGTSYGLLSSKHWLRLRWKYGSGDRYCLGSGLWR